MIDQTQSDAESAGGETATQPADPIEAKARELGWRPQSEYSGDPEDWLNPKEFLGRKPLHDKLKAQGKEIKAMRADFQKVAKGMAHMQAHAYQQALADLKAQRKAAMDAGDDDAVEQIDDAVTRTRHAKNQAEAAAKNTDSVVPPEVANWATKNPWFTQDAELRADAELYFRNYMHANPDAELDDALKYAERRTKAANPDKFKISTPKPSPVEGGRSPSGGTGGGKSYADMPKDARDACDVMVRKGLVSRENYVKGFFG